MNPLSFPSHGGRTMKSKTIARAFAERALYRFRESGGHEDGGRVLRYMTVQHRFKPASTYTLILALNRDTAQFEPDGCSCPSNRATEHCKHSIMYMIPAGQLADDIHARFDPEWIAQARRRKKKAVTA
jgi:hypothetical protein